MIKADIEAEIPRPRSRSPTASRRWAGSTPRWSRGGSRFIFRWAPWLFDVQYWLIAKFAPTRWLLHHLCTGSAPAGCCELIAEHEPDVIVSTYPGVTAVLGMLRENRRLPIPVQSAITDLAGLRYWAHPGVDLHFVTHPESIEEVERLVGPGSVEWMRPPISPRVPDAADPRATPARRSTCRRTPASSSSPAAAGGSATSRARSGPRSPTATPWSPASPAATRPPARSSSSASATTSGCAILGFTEQMSDWMAAADAMVHATAGLTVLEAHIRGCPVVSYGFYAGHLRANNAAFERFGLAEVARSEHELESMLRHVTRERRSPDSSFASLPLDLLAGPGGAPAGPPAAGLEGARRAHRDRRRLTAVVAVVLIAVALWLNWEAPYQGRSRSRSRAASTSARTRTAAGRRPKPRQHSRRRRRGNRGKPPPRREAP